MQSAPPKIDIPGDLSPDTITITIAADGRLLFHDLTADMLPIACTVCKMDEDLVRRLEALRALGE